MKIKLNAEKDKIINTTRHFHLRYQPTIRKPASKISYLRQPAFLDTETSHNHDEETPIGWIYQWCLEFAGEYCIGRKPSELISAFRDLHDHYELNEEKRLVVYVHNLSYDMVYLYKQLWAEFGDPKILAIKPHKILTATFDGLEFRCTYLLSNMSLSAWGDKLKCKVHKVDNGIDYDVIRYQNTRLSYQDWFYMVNDVAALKNCVYSEMIENDDNIVTIPLTSTGYVRRDCRKAFRKQEGTRDWFIKTRLSVNAYKANFFTYAGGLTHGNRYLAGQTIKDVDHIDFKSFYPANDQLRYMPMGKWEHVYNYLESDGQPFDMDRFERFLQHKCVIMLVSFKNLYLRKYVTCPALSKSKVYNFPFVKFTINDVGTIGTDNGRVINAIGDDVMVWLTELDYYWIVDQYKTDDVTILDLFICDRGFDTQAIRDVTNEYFKVKEGLEKDGYFYHKSKNRLNAIYGMKSTNPVRSQCELDLSTGKWSEIRDMSDAHIEEALDRYYKSYNSFNQFSHGVYITSWARALLLYVIKNIIGYPRFIYGDTDSAFYKRSKKIDHKLAVFNSEIVALNKKLGLGVPNRDGGISYYGVLEKEKPCLKFRFLHAKCYAFVDPDEQLHCTIAGVTSDNKRLKDDPLYMTREMELNDIEELHDNFTFYECGGTSSDYKCDYDPQIMNINGRNVEVAAACIIRQVTKTLGGTVDGFNIYEVNDHE